MRFGFPLLILLLGACGSGDPPGEMTNGAAAPEPGAPDNRIECRTGSAAAFDMLSHGNPCTVFCH